MCKVVGAFESPGTEVDSCENDFFPSIIGKILNFFADIFAATVKMSTSFDNGEAKSTKTITPSLDEDEFFRIDSLEFCSEMSDFIVRNLWGRVIMVVIVGHGFSFSIGIFSKNFDMVFEGLDFRVEGEKIFLGTAVFEGSAPAYVHFSFWGHFFCGVFDEFNPFSFCLICDDTAGDKNS